MAELGLFAVALPARYAQLAAPDQAVRAELTVLGLSPGMYAFYQVALDTIFVVVFATIGGLIFLRKRDDPVALLVALMLVTWGPGNDIMVLTPGAAPADQGQPPPPAATPQDRRRAASVNNGYPASQHSTRSHEPLTVGS